MEGKKIVDEKVKDELKKGVSISQDSKRILIVDDAPLKKGGK